MALDLQVHNNLVASFETIFKENFVSLEYTTYRKHAPTPIPTLHGHYYQHNIVPVTETELCLNIRIARIDSLRDDSFLRDIEHKFRTILYEGGADFRRTETSTHYNTSDIGLSNLISYSFTTHDLDKFTKHLTKMARDIYDAEFTEALEEKLSEN